MRAALLLALAPAVAAAQPPPPSVEAVRARAIERGLEAHSAGREERFCAGPPCPSAHERSDRELVVIAPDLLFVRGRHAGWMVEIAIGRTIPTFHFRFVRGEDAVEIGWAHRFEVPDGALAVTGEDAGADLDAWLRAELAAYLRSPASFRERALRRSRELRARARAAIGSLTVCDAPADPARFVCAPEADGSRALLDTCPRRPLGDAERAALLARLDRERAAHEARAVRHAARWHAALVRLLALPR
ncbi:MAG TPA: hypothetical protein VIL20_00990 [Sandaracinaceae bacterium]